MAVQLDRSRAVAHRQAQTQVSEGRSPLLDGGTFESMWRLAEALSYARTMPVHLKENPGDCLRVVEYAHRCGYSPFALADCTFLVGGKMGFEGKAVAAMVNASPLIDGALDYTYDGKGNDRRVTVSGRRRGEDKLRTVEWTVAQGIADSKGARDRWTKDPDQMLAYAGARIWARRHCPEAILGIYTPDELLSGVDQAEMIDITPRDRTPAAEHHEVEDAGQIQEPETSEPSPGIQMVEADGKECGVYGDAAEFVRGLIMVGKKMREDEKAAFYAANMGELRTIDADDTLSDALRTKARDLWQWAENVGG